MNTLAENLPRSPGQTSAGIDRRALVLLLGSCLTIMGAVFIAPILPKLQLHFQSVPNIAVLAPMALTVPALAIALLAPFAGAIVDFFGRKKLLLSATLFYAVFGTAPLYLESFEAIVASRVGLGLCEAAIMTCCTTLIGDYYQGQQREKYLALQSVFAAISSMVAFVLGGLLGEISWRAPFAMYGVSLLMLPLMYRVIREPKNTAQPPEQRGRGTGMPFKALAMVYLITFVGMVAFYLVPVQLPFLLGKLNIQSSSVTGVVAASAVAATLFGAFGFKMLINTMGTSVLNLVSFVVSGLGFLMIAYAHTLPMLVIGVLVNGFGSGFLIPNVVNWLMSLLDYEHRGRGTGGWTASFYFGQFLSPIVTFALLSQLGSLSSAVAWFGYGSILFATFAFLAPGIASRD